MSNPSRNFTVSEDDLESGKPFGNYLFSPQPSSSANSGLSSPAAIRSSGAYLTLDMTDLSPPISGNTTPEDAGHPRTPNMAELRQSLSFKSLRELELKEMRHRVWRRPGEKKKRPRDLEQLVIFAVRGGLRAFITGFMLRAGVNCVVACFKLIRSKTLTTWMILRAIWGVDSWRFGGMLGTYAFLYKLVSNALRIYNPGRRGKGKEEYWHAAVAGAVSGLGVLAEKRERRVTFGQQLLVRGFQGQYNIAKAKGWVDVPHGDVLLFGFSCAQIMYSWLMAPESLSPGYSRWVTAASRIAPPVLPINLMLYRQGKFPIDEARKILGWRNLTSNNKSKVERYITDAQHDIWGPPFAPCAVLHPWVDTCSMTQVDRWPAVFKWMFPVYSALHFIPPMLLRRKLFLSDPNKMLLRSAFGTIRSCAFLATFVTIFQSLACLQRNLYEKLGNRLPSFTNTILLSRYYYWASGFIACFALFLEEKKRRGELAMYVLPRALESAWANARRRAWVPFVPMGEVIMSSAGLAMVMSSYDHDPAKLSGLVRNLVYQFVGPS